MFNPFFTTRHTGTGLGLAIVHRILDAHAGRVDIQPNTQSNATDARGTVVELLLPEDTVHRSLNGEQP
jgi:nitrogen fixation/metabolism regulation signal transduction histidine kinase